ncbi:MAG TPA: ECF transporter S component [Clostridia bacterium]|nr:ECF transporter S component [Clostridia bacterium]
MITDIKNMAKGALFIALGVSIPQLFHSIGMGSVFLPMHIPVLLAGFLAGPLTGIYVGILTPILSHLLTGMPPVAPIPILPIMVFELLTYGFIAGILYNKLRINIFVSLFSSMLAGRIMHGLVVYIILMFFNVKMQNPLIAVITAVETGIIGILIQIAVIPIIVKLLEGEFINVGSNIGPR